MLIPWKKYDHKDKDRYCLTVYRQLRRYCNNPRSRLFFGYGAKGIECEFTSAVEIEYLYTRDNVSQMTEPHFCRIDDVKNFSRDNCQFLDEKEWGEHVVQEASKLRRPK